jgi:hypothetical protein
MRLQPQSSEEQIVVSPFWAKVIAGVAVVVLTAGAGAAIATYSGVQDLTRRVEALERQRDGDRNGSASSIGRIEERLRGVEIALRAVETRLEFFAAEVRP